jgi:hypothetical protein
MIYNLRLQDKGVEYPEYDPFDRDVYEWLLQFKRERTGSQ